MGEIFNKSYADYSSKPDAKQAFTACKFKWVKQVALDACNLPPLASAVCALLLQHFNLEHGSMAWMYQDTLATMLGVRRECICKVFGALVERGHLFEERQGRDKPNHYWMVLKEDAQDVRKNAHHAAKEAPLDVRENAHHPDYDVRDQRLRCAQKRTETPITIPGSTSCSPGEREAADAAASGDLGPDGPPRRQGKKKGSRRPGNARHSPGGGAPAIDEATLRAGFAEIRAAHPRPWIDDDEDDYRAYCEALQLTDHVTLLAFIKANAKAADKPRYLKSLAILFDRRAWEKKPWPTKASKANGNGRRSNNGARHRRAANSVEDTIARAVELKKEEIAARRAK